MCGSRSGELAQKQDNRAPWCPLPSTQGASAFRLFELLCPISKPKGSKCLKFAKSGHDYCLVSTPTSPAGAPAHTQPASLPSARPPIQPTPAPSARHALPAPGFEVPVPPPGLSTPHSTSVSLSSNTMTSSVLPWSSTGPHMVLDHQLSGILVPSPPLLHRLPDVCAISSGLADTQQAKRWLLSGGMPSERHTGQGSVSAIYCNSRCHITNHPKTATLFLVHGSWGPATDTGPSGACPLSAGRRCCSCRSASHCGEDNATQ